MNTIELNNVSFSYKNNIVFDHLSFKIKNGHHTSIVCSMGEGKTTLANILKYNLKYSGSFLINGVEVVKTNEYVVDRFINMVSIDSEYDNKKVIDLLFDFLADEYDEEELENEVNKIIKYFKLKEVLNYKLDDLDDEYKYYVMIIIKLLDSNTFLILDDVLIYIREDYIKYIYNYAKKNKVTIINLTSSLRDSLYSEYLIFIYNKGIAMEGETLLCLKEEQLIKRLGFNLPFIVDLSTQLNYYDLLDDIYTDRDEMIDLIWK